MKKCILILPYFGEFNNYFPFFLQSCGSNYLFDWLIVTDNSFGYDIPKNVHVKKMSFEDFKKLTIEKFGFDTVIPKPYKLCDFKPSYGFLFEDVIYDYDYWGHCDCDLIFGDLNSMLMPLLDCGYDKIFAAGHLTIYKNNYDNNRRFMLPYHGRLLYKEAFTTSKTYAFDEDCASWLNPDANNVHSIFLEDGASVYCKDLCFNVAIRSAALRRAYYDPSLRQFIKEPLSSKSAIFWNNGKVLRLTYDHKVIKQEEYLYLHLQMRPMKFSIAALSSDVVGFMPTQMVPYGSLPSRKNEMHLFKANHSIKYWIIFFWKYYFLKGLKKIKRLAFGQ